jgi:type IV secretory pathway VirB9-like protein
MPAGKPSVHRRSYLCGRRCRREAAGDVSLRKADLDNEPVVDSECQDANGRKVYIEFPRGISQGEMPPLFIVGPEGKTSELVNYRVRGNHMVVDRLFAAAELRLGDRGSERRVRIVRTDGRLLW